MSSSRLPEETLFSFRKDVETKLCFGGKRGPTVFHFWGEVESEDRMCYGWLRYVYICDLTIHICIYSI